MTKWPILFEELLRIGNLESNIGVCTLWTERDKVQALLDPDTYCVIGNLYRNAGISPMLRNIFANPRIRYIALWGKDLLASGDDLLAFMSNGVDDDYRIIGSKGRIEREIDRGSIFLFRQSVTVLDLRGKSVTELRETISQLPPKEPFCEPRTFRKSKVSDAQTFPSEPTGFRVQGKTVAQTWLKVINTVMSYGRDKGTRYAAANRLKEMLNIVAVVTDEDPSNLYLPGYLSVSRQELEEYYPQVLTPKHIEGAAYVYGERLRNHNGIDQIQKIIELAKLRPDSKRIFASTWNVEVDSNDLAAGDKPCLTQLMGGVQNWKFYLTAHFRSQDMYNGWPQNMFAMRQLQKLISDEIGFSMGPLTMITHSAHIYSDDWEAASEILKKHYLSSLKYKRGARWEADPRGYFVISVKDSRIVATLYSPDHEPLKSFDGKTAQEVGRRIADYSYIVMPSHLLYLGSEFQKAEHAIRLGIPYVQDKALAI